MNNKMVPVEEQFVLILNHYFTPFVIILISAGLLFAPIELELKKWILGILIFSVTFNIVTRYIAAKWPMTSLILGYLRVGTNFVCNILFVYLMGGAWGPVWLLFVLAPLAMAMYSTRKKTLIMAFVAALTLGAIYYFRGLSSSTGWAQVGIHMGFIFFISLFVNTLAQLAREHHLSIKELQDQKIINND